MRLFVRKRQVWLYSAVFLVSGCLSMEQLTSQGTTAVLPYTEQAIQEQTNLDAWRRGGPSGIQMLEGMLKVDPQNKALIAALAKAYNAYATLIAETDLMEDVFLDRSYSRDRDLAVDYHSQAVNHAKNYLRLAGLKWSKNPDDLREGLTHLSNSSQQSIDVAFVLTQSMKSIIALQRKLPAMLELMSLSDVLADWTCKAKLPPTYPAWGCSVMQAVELAEKPVVAGGNPKEARKRFDQLIAQYPNDLLIVALRAQTVLTKIRDEAAWKDTKLFYHKHLSQYDQTIRQRLTDSTTPDKNGLANAAAAERIRQLIRYERELF